MTGAEMDLPQFIQIFGDRAAGAKVTIPRAVERWFDAPSNDGERQVKALIDQYRAQEVSKLEAELFALRKRKADAERKLALKETKAARESLRIAGDKESKAKGRLDRLKDGKIRDSDARIFPFNYAPVVINDGGRNVVRLARYHCRLAGKPEAVDKDYPGLYNARRDNIEQYWRAAFGQSHALMLVSSFFENVQRDGRNAVLHFNPQPADVMLIACVYSEWLGPAGERLLSFAAITDEPPAEVAAAGHDRMIVNIRPESVASWLSPQGQALTAMQAILGDRQTPYYAHEVLAA